MNIIELKQTMKKKLKKRFLKVRKSSTTGIERMRALKLSRLTDVLAIAGISLVLLLTVVITVPVMFVYVAVVGAIILWDNK